MGGLVEAELSGISYLSSMRRSIVIGPPCSAIEANTAEPPNRYSPYERSACFSNPSSLKMCCDMGFVASVTADVYPLAAPLLRHAATSSRPMPRRVYCSATPNRNKLRPRTWCMGVPFEGASY